MQNARSYLGRFSGLALFLIALLVVGLLVIFTVRSANDDDGVVNTDDGTSTSQSEPEVAGSDDADGDDSDQPVGIPDLDSTPAVTGDRTDDDQSGEVASAENGLPNTGPEDALIPAFVVGVLIFQILSWRQSRRQLIESASQTR